MCSEQLQPFSALAGVELVEDGNVWEEDGKDGDGGREGFKDTLHGHCLCKPLSIIHVRKLSLTIHNQIIGTILMVLMGEIE